MALFHQQRACRSHDRPLVIDDDEIVGEETTQPVRILLLIQAPPGFHLCARDRIDIGGPGRKCE
jgi:hypothetical protein